MNDVADRLRRPEFPRAAKYDPTWILDNQMGPNALWLAEWLCESLALQPGMRVLDLGCGKAMTSIFLAREFGVHVWAADLWMSPDHNWRRAVEAGVGDLLCPIKAEAHALPFAQNFFDAVVSIDSYQYYGSDELYLDYLARFVRPGGLFGLVLVGLAKEMGAQPPAHLLAPQANGKVFWDNSCRCFKTARFWRELWTGCDLVADVAVEQLADGWRYWRDFEQLLEDTGKGIFPSDVEALERDHGEYMAFLRMTARRTTKDGWNFYDPAMGVRFGTDR